MVNEKKDTEKNKRLMTDDELVIIIEYLSSDINELNKSIESIKESEKGWDDFIKYHTYNILIGYLIGRKNHIQKTLNESRMMVKK